MCRRLVIAVLFVGGLDAVGSANAAPMEPFTDGLWNGGVGTALDGSTVEECWASTMFSDDTTLTVTFRVDGDWRLRLSNPNWHLPKSHQYAMIAMVDFYPKLHVVAEAKSPTRLEIADISRGSLLGLIENGHTIELASDGFTDRYDLEGSAKVIQRLRTCFDN